MAEEQVAAGLVGGVQSAAETSVTIGLTTSASAIAWASTASKSTAGAPRYWGQHEVVVIEVLLELLGETLG